MQRVTARMGQFEGKKMQEDVCANCERMRRARKLPPEWYARMNYGGRRPGAGRKPTTLKGILKKLPKEAAELLERELKAKAELILVGIKLEMLIKAKVTGESGGNTAQNSGNTARSQKGLKDHGPHFKGSEQPRNKQDIQIEGASLA